LWLMMNGGQPMASNKDSSPAVVTRFKELDL
jgi:hypothetical protein